MEQTDILFKSFIRFLPDALQEIRKEPDEEKWKGKMERVINNLQKVLETRNARRYALCKTSSNSALFVDSARTPPRPRTERVF